MGLANVIDRLPPDDPDRRFDLITMGRAIVDVYGEQVGCRLEDVSSFAKYVGGCPANIAIGAARLGLRVAMITRVGDEQHGRFIREALAREGVDVSRVRTDPRRPTGVAFLGIRDRETFPLLHYREDCADMAIAPADYTADFIGSARALLVSGSHLTTAAAADNVRVAIERARERRTRVVFDIDYRPLFWGLAQRDLGESRYIESATVTAATQRFLDRCDMVVGTDDEIRIAGGADDTLAALRTLRGKTAAVIVLKRGPLGCVAFEDAIPARIEDGLVVPGFAVDVFNVVGAGDGFMGGLLYGWLRGRPLAEACRIGNACGALVVSRHGCSPASPTKQELDWFLARVDGRRDLHRDPALVSLHRATTRRHRPAWITAFELDAPFAVAAGRPHARRADAPRRDAAGQSIPGASRVGAAGKSMARESPAEEARESIAGAPRATAAGESIANAARATEARAERFTVLVAEAVRGLAARAPGIGIALAHPAGEPALYRVASELEWVARRIDVPSRDGLAFEDDLTAGVLLRHWPLQLVVKCAVGELARAPEAARIVQRERLRELHLACRHYGHELLLDFHPCGERALDVLESLRDTGIVADWWQLPAAVVRANAPALRDLLHASAPHCRGVLASVASDAPANVAAERSALLESGAGHGVAVGQTLLEPFARRFVAGHSGDEETLAGLRGAIEEVVLETARAA